MTKQTSGIFLIFLLDRDNLNCGEIEKGTIVINFFKKNSATSTVPVFILRRNMLNSAQGSYQYDYPEKTYNLPNIGLVYCKSVTSWKSRKTA